MRAKTTSATFPPRGRASYFYDAYGNFLTRGWLIYDWRQENPQPFGSAVQKTWVVRRFLQLPCGRL